TGDEAASSPDWLMIRETLRGRSDEELAKARTALAALFEQPTSESTRRQRIALIGLRGAGKSCLGRALASEQGVPFIELSAQIEALAGCGIDEIHSLYGQTAYRRYEQRALEDVIRAHARAVIATPGGIVSEPATFNLLLTHCYTVWLRATPEEHMSRVLAQGDRRPMAGNREAMDDLKRILESRAQFYSKADQTLNTSGVQPEQALARLRDQLSA
ncbi:MAG: helix-turn-helix transcriptional regulator, partial [Betaproteobacteria bacterium]